MNVQEYISSGIIESYVLGLAEPEERAAFERMCDLHPEIREARDAFELSLEESIMMNQSQPPRNIKSKIFAAIDLEMEGLGEENPPKLGPPLYTAEDKQPAKVIGMGYWQRYMAAASVVLLLGSTALNFYFFNKYKEYNERYQSLVLQQTELASHNQVMQTRLLEYEKAVELMKNPNMAIVKMPSIPNGPDLRSATTVYWDTLSKDVYLAVNQLPTPADNEQYQLWALVDGQPVDAGVFDIKEGPGMIKMKNIPRANAFAITLEKKGGSPTPNLQKLYVMGKV